MGASAQVKDISEASPVFSGNAIRMGTSIFSLILLPINNTNMAGIIPKIIPERITVPNSIPRLSAMISGPGVGGTILWVMAAPPPMAIT